MTCAFLRRFIYVPILLLLFGCVSQEAQLNDISLTPMNFEVTAPVTVAKIMVWGRSASGDAFAKVVDPNALEDSYEWYRNGNWTVYSIGWLNADLSGSIYCSRVERKFEGPKETNKIELTSAGCNHADFAGALTAQPQLGVTRLELCESVRGISSANANCTDNIDDSFRIQGRGHAMSYRISLRSFMKKGKKTTYNSEKLLTVCKDATPSSGTPDSGLAQGTLSNIPIGDGSTTPFNMQIEAFPGSASCDSTSHGSHTVDLPNGYRSRTSNTFYDVDAAPAHKLYLKMSTDEICKGNALTQNFAGGVDASAFTVGQKDLSNASPRLICNATQFYNTLTSQYQSFKLLKDIDLRSYAKGVTPNAYLDGIANLQDGSNYFPLGLNPASLLRLAGGRADFPYNFDGGGKTITGMKIHIDPFYSPACVGFTCYRTGHYRRLKLVDWDMKGNDSVSTLGGVHGSIHHLEVIRPRVRGATGVGGVAHSAKMFNGSALNIRVSSARVEGSGFCGGVFGFTDYSGAGITYVMENVSVDGVVKCTGDFSGGIIGQQNYFAGYFVTLAKTRFEGAVSGSAYVGGLVGHYANTTLSSAYANAYLTASRNGIAVRLGGLLGGSNFDGLSAITLDNSYFLGTGKHSCPAVNNTCLVGNLVGQPTASAPSVNNSYHRNLAVGLTSTDVGTVATLNDFYGVVNMGTNFDASPDDIPRLKYETGSYVPTSGDFLSPCRGVQSVSAQIISGKGVSSSNPISICNGRQFALMTNYTDKHFSILKPIYVHDMAGNATAVLTGSIEGNNQPVFGMTLQQTVATLPLYEETAGTFNVITWWKALKGRVFNLYLYAPIISHIANTNAAAFVALENYSKIDNLRIEDLRTDLRPLDTGTAVRGLGVIAGYNYGTISNSHVSGDMNVATHTSGFAYINYTDAVITDSSTTVNLKCDQSGGFDCALLAGFSVAQKGTITRSYAGGTLTGNIKIRGDSTSSFSTFVRGNVGTIEDVHVSGASQAKYDANAGILNLNAGILKRAYSESDVKTLNNDQPAVLPGSPAQADWLKLSNGGVGFLDPAGTNEDVLLRYPGRYYFSDSVYGINTYNSGTCTIKSSLMSTQWDILTNPTYYFAAKDVGPNRDRMAILTAMPSGGALQVTTQTCPFASPGTILFGYETPAATWQTQITAPLALSTYAGFDNHTNSLGNRVWLANLNDSGDINRVGLIRIALKKGTALPEVAPTWVFDTTNGVRLWQRYLEE